MADLIIIKGGKGDVPQLQDKELGYSRDEKALYIGTANGNVKLCNADDIFTILSHANTLTEHKKELDDIKKRLDALEEQKGAEL